MQAATTEPKTINWHRQTKKTTDLADTKPEAAKQEATKPEAAKLEAKELEAAELMGGLTWAVSGQDSRNPTTNKIIWAIKRRRNQKDRSLFLYYLDC